jgi:histidine triad (HIT) family protein
MSGTDAISCAFCDIVAGRSVASRIFEDELVLAFMGIQPIRPGECLVIPKAHVDHFTDMDDLTAQRLMLVGQRIGRRMRAVFAPERVGMVVHGFGIPHAHLILVPQHQTDDITSARFCRIENGRAVFSVAHVPMADRHVLDEHARLLGIEG